MFRRKRYSLKIKVVGLSLLCLCILTLGYANYTQDISIEGTVEGLTTFSLERVVEDSLSNDDLESVGSVTYGAKPFVTLYYFKGDNPNNYVIYANKCFRMVNITSGGYVKMVYESNISTNGTCDTSNSITGLINGTYRYNAIIGDYSSGVNNWFDTTNDAVQLRNDLEDMVTAGNVGGILLSNTDINNIANATWYVGAVNNTNQSISDDIQNEKTNQGNTALQSLAELGKSEYDYTGKVGLLSVTDYVRASGNNSCDSVYSGTSESNPCASNNYLSKDYVTIFMNPVGDTTDQIWAVNEQGRIITKNVYDEVYIRPVFYLSNTVSFAGAGTVNNPYIVI